MFFVIIDALVAIVVSVLFADVGVSVVNSFNYIFSGDMFIS